MSTANPFEPARYPANNTEELSAVVAFLGLIDKARVKPHVNSLDKIPNHDGTVELVDEYQRPIGELKVQVRKIPKDATRYDCPVELVAYSTRISLPLLLICVDVDNNKAYWCHVHALMPELKKEQKTFTVNFQQNVDQVGKGFPYFERWYTICADYLSRVSEYPELKNKLDDRIGLSAINAKDRELFQTYAGEINTLLDVDFPIVKHEFFANAWKLGVNIHHANPETISYSIFTIPNGENAPILLHTPTSSGMPKITSQDGKEIAGLLELQIEPRKGAVAIQWMRRDQFLDASVKGKKFIARYLERLFRDKRLQVHGANHSAELLLWFLRRYAHTVGLPSAGTYLVEDVYTGLNLFLPFWYGITFPRVMAFFKRKYPDMLKANPFPSFEQIAGSVVEGADAAEAEVLSAIESGRDCPSAPFRADSFSFESLQQAIAYLRVANVLELSDKYRPTTKQEARAWKCYSPEDYVYNFKLAYEQASQDYPAFVKGNQFGRFNSKLISGEVALVVAMDSRDAADGWAPPTVVEFIVPNPKRTLPFLTFIDRSKDSDRLVDKGLNLTLDGIQIQALQSHGGLGIMGFGSLPVRTLLYDWLKRELQEHYPDVI